MKWIRVEDRLPDNVDRVFILALNDINDYCYPYVYNDAVECGFYEGGKWFSDTRFDILDIHKDKATVEQIMKSEGMYRLWGNIDVTHWMPLPVPPQEDEHE